MEILRPIAYSFIFILVFCWAATGVVTGKESAEVISNSKLGYASARGLSIRFYTSKVRLPSGNIIEIKTTNRMYEGQVVMLNKRYSILGFRYRYIYQF